MHQATIGRQFTGIQPTIDDVGTTVAGTGVAARAYIILVVVLVVVVVMVMMVMMTVGR